MTTSTSSTAWQRLAGVEHEYWDIWGNHHPVDETGMRAILAALGHSAADEAAVAASIARLEEAPWRRALPPVLIVAEGAPARVPVVLPRPALDLPIQCRLMREDGGALDFVFEPTRPIIEAERRVDGADLVRLTLTVPGRSAAGLSPPRPRRRGDGGDAAGGDAPDRRARALLSAAGPGRRRAHLGPLGAALLAPSSRQLGDRRFHRPRDGDRYHRRSRRRHPRPQSGALAVSRTAGLGEPLLALQPAVPQPALHRRRGDSGVRHLPRRRETLARHAADASPAWRDERYVAYAEIAPFKQKVLYALYEWFVRPGDKERAHAERQAAFERFCDEGGVPARPLRPVQRSRRNLRRYPLAGMARAAIAGPTRPNAGPSPRSTRRVSSSSCTCSGSPTNSSRRRRRAPTTAAWRVGLYVDLAVGAAREGADAWANPDVIVQEAKVGCPPDPFNMMGQDWSIPPLHPHRLARARLRAVHRHAAREHAACRSAPHRPRDGAACTCSGSRPTRRRRAAPTSNIRSKTCSPWSRWKASGRAASSSARTSARCPTVSASGWPRPTSCPTGSSTSNAPPTVTNGRRSIRRWRWHASQPMTWPRCGVTGAAPTSPSSRNSPSIRRRTAVDSEKTARVHDRYLLLRALAAEGLLPSSRDPDNVDGAPMDANLAAAMHAFLARSPAQILLVQIDDLMEEHEQINLPGTNEERPNWRRKLSNRWKPCRGCRPSAPSNRCSASAKSPRRERAEPRAGRRILDQRTLIQHEYDRHSDNDTPPLRCSNSRENR